MPAVSKAATYYVSIGKKYVPRFFFGLAKPIAIIFCVGFLFFGLFGVKNVYAAYITNPPNENDLQWKLDDNAANTTVTGSEVNGALVGGNTADVVSTVNGYPAFHLNGSTQYASVTVPYIWPSAVANLWTKYASNPVLSLPSSISFGQLTKNSAGGWYFFGSYENSISRWESSDLITWTNRIQVLAAGGAGAWDNLLQVATVFQKPDGAWIMLYRGYNNPTYQIGLATSTDGATFTRKNNGGVNDGLFPQFGTNYDPVGVMLVGTTYYVYLNGSPTHGVTNIYYSTDDFATFTANANNPLFPSINSAAGAGAFCASVWNYSGYYYMLISRDLVLTGSALYDHGIALYRSTSPTFDVNNTEFLGYAVVNDQSYDNRYLDTPSIPTTDVYRTTYAPEFGNTLYALYSGEASATSINTQSLAYTTFGALSSEKLRINQIYGDKTTYSFWVQFDSLTAGDPVFSVGSTPTDDTPVWFGVIKTSGTDKVLSLYLGGAYRNTSSALAINTPYHIVIVEDITDKKVYINDILVGTFTQDNTAVDANYLYIGKGFGTRFLDGYVWDFRIYPKDLTTTEIGNLYTTGSIYITPTVITTAATLVSTSTATLNGNITLTGGADATQSGFAYGTVADLQSVVATTTLDGQTGTASFSQNFTGLTPNTTYYFRAYAVNSAGTSTGSILSFATTDTTPPSVSVTTPANLATVSGLVTLTADATDDIGVTGVQFTLNGANYGQELTTAPYTTTWDTTTLSDDNYTLAATVRDTSNNYATSTITVTVKNTADRHSAGTSVSQQLQNLQAMGNTQATEQLKLQYPGVLAPLPTELETLLAKITELRAQIAVLSATTHLEAERPSFTRSLSFGLTGADVKQLQQFLNTHGFILAKAGPGSLGKETTMFGYLTKVAVIKFQRANQIDPIGVVGPRTRGVMEKLLKYN